jgi:uncharacterized protein YraI
MRKLVLICLCLLLTACNLPLGEDSGDDMEKHMAATIVAMTLNAANTIPTNTRAPLPTPTLGVTKTPTPTITPTYSVPLLTVNEPTNCRTGPGQSYDIIFTLLAGATVEIVGRYPTNNYWTVKVQGLDEPCWVWGEYSTASGSHWTVPTVNPPATASPSPPEAPSISNWEYECGFGNVTVTLEWRDRADDESGYRIYRNGESIAELPPNSSAFTEVVESDPGESFTYLIEVVNSAGTASSSPINFSCQ